MSKPIIAILCALLVSGCAVATKNLDERTGTTLAERCVDYRTAALALGVRERSGELTETERDMLAIYRAFLDAKCPLES